MRRHGICQMFLPKISISLIDTGSVKTFISQKVKNELELETISTGSMSDASNNTTNTCPNILSSIPIKRFIFLFL